MVTGIFFPESRFDCIQCGRSYKHKKNLQTHKKYQCGIGAIHECIYCKKKYRQRSTLKRHLYFCKMLQTSTNYI